MSINFETDKVNLRVNNRVATIELNRPDALNAMDTDVIKGLVYKLKEISDSDEIDILVVTGKGRAFSSGGDIKTMLSNMNESDFFPVMDCISELIITLYSLPKLTISAVSGAAAGLGFSLALATDYIIADKTSKLAMNFIGIGLIPDGGAHFFLEKRLGETMAKQVIWDGKMLSADEAFKMGLIQEVAEKGLQETLEARVQDWLSRPVQAMIKTKKIMAEKNRPQLLKVLELEKYGQQKMRETLDHREGIRAFIEKRKPFFIGK
ncbi:enoyl-CoA hydratase [Bacillus sp. AFS076308]|uniref:enoyl-CoA hydratase n=1 Tax=unclassified Bacillus (in: firmicutes) TaxID=185979 RepID=UPI000BF50E61|nr:MULTISPECIES: enoyl-CoA hydratase [unclassified Bacillus (in: firmicutes)]PFO04277.1 enoyl-CoA hydratase [Bacillus sp. AFS076308]PGV51916.1 enoyl-CoA hydratase [Bacillus sp. AFS037270]